MDKKLIFGAVILGGLLMISSSSSSSSTATGGGGGGADPCPKYFNVSGTRICETLLPDMGYVYWKGGAGGDGWYSYSQFPAQYGMSQAAFNNIIKSSAANTLNPSHVQYTQSQAVLNNAYRGGLGPLVQMP